MMVKICGITNRDDATAAAEGGASALGFNFYSESPRYIAPDAAQAILEELPPGIMKVGVFVNANPASVAKLVSRLGLDIAQLHGDRVEAAPGVRVWRALRVTGDFNLSELAEFSAEAFLLDTPAAGLHGGTGRTFEWSRARGALRPVIIAGGLDDTNVRRAIEEAQPWGVDACSRLESAPGRKDRAKLARFLKAALA